MGTSTRVTLIGDTSRRDNWGCRATTSGLKRLIGIYSDEGWSFDLKDFRRPRNLPERVARRLGLVHPLDVDAASLEQTAGDLLERRLLPEVMQAIVGSDAVIVNGEGGLLGNKWTGRLSLLLSYAAVRAGVPTAIVNHTVDLTDPGLADLAAVVYPLVDDVVVREPNSLEAVRGLRDGLPLSMAADAALLFRSNKPMGGHICVGGSAGYNVPDRDTAGLIESFTRLCERLSEFADVVITVSSPPDDEFLGVVATRLGLPIYGFDTPTEVAVDLLATARLYVGGRWHPSLMALTGGTPIVPLGSNSAHKALGVAELSGSGPPIDAAEVGANIDVILERAIASLADGERQARKDRVAGFASTVVDNVRILAR